MKKTLFALLALATMMPAIAFAEMGNLIVSGNWNFGFGTADIYNNDKVLDNYSFYILVRENTTASLVSSAIQEQTLSEFLADAGQRYEFNETSYDTINCGFYGDSGLSRDISASDTWGISVYQNGDKALFQVREVYDFWVENNDMLAYSDYNIPYTSFKSDSPAVPEPATATLSLLALAGLATRRKRK
ncbi:MAG: PEP-CTERM sorting domain-containing protein [Synergistaceae bacterium]|nr:PEP-CTERM sorting domain-containing protein [Candidatus Equadaptatus faecalis]